MIFGFPATDVIASVLVYRLIAFWMPLPPGIVAFLQLRRTVARWESEGRPVVDDEDQDNGDNEDGGRNGASPASSNTSQNEVRYEDQLPRRSQESK